MYFNNMFVLLALYFMASHAMSRLLIRLCPSVTGVNFPRPHQIWHQKITDNWTHLNTAYFSFTLFLRTQNKPRYNIHATYFPIEILK